MSSALLALCLVGTIASAPAAGAQDSGPQSRAAAVGDARAEPAGAGLSDAELDRRAAEVADQLRCPVCRNQSVLESSSRLAREMQGVIRERLAAGESPEQVKAYFVRSYGDWILLQPEPEGFNLLVYALPAALLLAGGVVVILLVRRWSAPSASSRDAGTTGTGGEATGADGTRLDGAPPHEEGGHTGSSFSPEEERWLREAMSER